MTVERCEMLAQFSQIQELIDTSEEMINRYVCFKIEGVEQPILVACLLTHHPDVPSSLFLLLGHRPSSTVQRSFSTQ